MEVPLCMASVWEHDSLWFVILRSLGHLNENQESLQKWNKIFSKNFIFRNFFNFTR